jgi:hypothetical protein
MDTLSIQNHRLTVNLAASSAFNEMLNVPERHNNAAIAEGVNPFFQSPLYPESNSERLQNRINAAIDHARTVNDYSPATIEVIKQKIDNWQADINALRANGDNPTADQSEATLLQSLANFQQTLETAHQQTLQTAQAQQTAQPQAPEPDSVPQEPMGGGEETLPEMAQ